MFGGSNCFRDVVLSLNPNLLGDLLMPLLSCCPVVLLQHVVVEMRVEKCNDTGKRLSRAFKVRALVLALSWAGTPRVVRSFLKDDQSVLQATAAAGGDKRAKGKQ